MVVGPLVPASTMSVFTLKFENNNCWMNAAGAVLQLMDVDHPHIVAMKNRNPNDFVKFARTLVPDGPGDPLMLVEHYSPEITGCVKLELACDCGVTYQTITGAVFYLKPAWAEVFTNCTVCHQPKLICGVETVGSGLFVFNPDIFTPLGKYVGGVRYSCAGIGHFYVQLYDPDILLDGDKPTTSMAPLCALVFNGGSYEGAHISRGLRVVLGGISHTVEDIPQADSVTASTEESSVGSGASDAQTRNPSLPYQAEYRMIGTSCTGCMPPESKPSRQGHWAPTPNIEVTKGTFIRGLFTTIGFLLVSFLGLLKKHFVVYLLLVLNALWRGIACFGPMLRAKSIFTTSNRLTPYRKNPSHRTWYALIAIRLCICIFMLYGLFRRMYHPFCDDYVDGFSRTFVKGKVCGFNILCHACLLPYTDLASLNHINVEPTYLYTPWPVSLYTAIKVLLVWFIAPRYWKVLGVLATALMLHSVIPDEWGKVYCLTFIGLDPVASLFLALAISARLCLTVGHLLHSCSNPKCVRCSHVKVATVFTVQIPYKGSMKTVTVNANGIGKVCPKHNFYCADCETTGPSSTFIIPAIVYELSKACGRTVVPTVQEDYLVATSIEEVQSGYKVTARDVSYIVTREETLVEGGPVYTYDGTTKGEAAAVALARYYAQQLCQPIILVKASLWDSFQHSHSYLSTQPMFAKCKSYIDCARMCGEELAAFIAKEEIPCVTGEANNYVPRAMVRAVRSLNLGCDVYTGAPRDSIWSLDSLISLSQQQRDKLFQILLRAGGFKITTGKLVEGKGCSRVGLHGGGKVRWFSATIMLLLALVLFYNQPPVPRIQPLGFSIITNGVLKPVYELPCAYNVYPEFENLHVERYGYVPTHSAKCPVVVAHVKEGDYAIVPGVPAQLTMTHDLAFVMSPALAPGGCYRAGSGFFADPTCYFTTPCAYVATGALYCYKEGLLPGALSYADLGRNVPLTLSHGLSFMLPYAYYVLGVNMLFFEHGTYCVQDKCVTMARKVCITLGEWHPESQGACGANIYTLLWASVSQAPSHGFMTSCLLAVAAFFTLSLACILLGKMRSIYGVHAEVCCHFGLGLVAALFSLLLPVHCTIPLAFFLFMGLQQSRFTSYALAYAVVYVGNAPVSLLLGVACLGVLFAILPYVAKPRLVAGDFVADYNTAARSTFMINGTVYQALVNEVGIDAIKTMAARANHYRTVAGPMSPVEYLAAARSFLAKSLVDFSRTNSEVLYTPPRYACVGGLQAGLKRLLTPSGPLEHCVVVVSCGNTVLNGLWLNDHVYCPRHVISKDTRKKADYEYLLSVTRPSDIHVSYQGKDLPVRGVSLKGVLLVLKTDTNDRTPKHQFVVAQPGAGFTIMLSYGGKPLGIYGVTMKSNGTVAGSFEMGACGSVGYTSKDGVIQICYMHHMQLASGSHVGSDLFGAMYGGFTDQPDPQFEVPDLKSTVNTCAYLCAARRNGYNITANPVSVEDYNQWAVSNGYAPYDDDPLLTQLCATVGLSPQVCLGYIQNNFNVPRKMLGYYLTDEFTPPEVLSQVGVLQSRVQRYGYTVLCCFVTLFMGIGLQWLNLATPRTFLYVATAAISAFLVRYKMLFLLGFVVPTVVEMACNTYDLHFITSQWFCLLRLLLYRNWFSLVSLPVCAMTPLHVSVLAPLPWVGPAIAPYVSDPLVYIIVGIGVCGHYGLVHLINRTLRLMLCGEPYRVSADEFRFMRATGIMPPKNSLQAILLTTKLSTLGGPRNLPLAKVQASITDIKCATQALLPIVSDQHMKPSVRNELIKMHNAVFEEQNPQAVVTKFLSYLASVMSILPKTDLDVLVDTYLGDNNLLSVVQSQVIQLESWARYEETRQAYESAVEAEKDPHTLKVLRKAMNVAKSDYDREIAVQKKLEKLAAAAATTMYKEVRVSDRRRKLMAAMHAVFVGLLKKLNVPQVEGIMLAARNGVVPLNLIPRYCANKLQLVVPSPDAMRQTVTGSTVTYAGDTWCVDWVRDSDGNDVHLADIEKPELMWPLQVMVSRQATLQNNELAPGVRVKEVTLPALVGGKPVSVKGFIIPDKGQDYVCAVLTTHVGVELKSGVQLDPPLTFTTATSGKPYYLSFVKNLNTFRRGAVLGHVGAIVRLQAGTKTEYPENSELLTACSFAVDAGEAYKDARRRGAQPLVGCIRMCAAGFGSGRAITSKVEASQGQISYAGSSVCIYCRAFVEHSNCKYRGKFVQVPEHETDPILFCLENTPCLSCGKWTSICGCGETQAQQADPLNGYGALVELS